MAANAKTTKENNVIFGIPPFYSKTCDITATAADKKYLGGYT